MVTLVAWYVSPPTGVTSTSHTTTTVLVAAQVKIRSTHTWRGTKRRRSGRSNHRRNQATTACLPSTRPDMSVRPGNRHVT
jgi:hypothetical protein